LIYDFKYVEYALKTANKLHDWYQDFLFYEENREVLKRNNSVQINNRIDETQKRYSTALKIINLFVEEECNKNHISSYFIWYTPPKPNPYQQRDLYTAENIHIWQLKDELARLTEKIPFYVLLENGIDVVKSKFLEWVQEAIKNELQKSNSAFG
jgi:hypothetical protein